MNNNIIKIHPLDNVGVALRDISTGEVISIGKEALRALSDIPMGHKIALYPIAPGENVVKYGSPIGRASCSIRTGEHVHSHNLVSSLQGLLDYSYHPSFQDLPLIEGKIFPGFRREDGRVGIRNHVWIIPTVGCVNAVAKELAARAQKYKSGTIDEICAFSHPYGCSQLGEDLSYTQKALCGLIRHPNAGGVLVLGLGCENNSVEELKKELGPYDPERVKFLVCQETENELEEGERLLEFLCRQAGRACRTSCGAGELVIGLKCGGSDGFSGVSANPLVGRVSERILSQGGSVLLTEVPEMFGAEQLLMNRCRSHRVFEQTVNLINDFKGYFIRYGEKINENPSPGNKAGGITTLEEKSLGCIQKGGHAPVEDVLSYGEAVRQKGLSLLNGPGNDLVSSLALAASGAQLILFTTGRGTPFGCPVPTVKISSNSPLYERKKHWIDFDAGRFLDTGEGEILADELENLIFSVASGQKAKTEDLDHSSLAIFKDGVTL